MWARRESSKSTEQGEERRERNEEKIEAYLQPRQNRTVKVLVQRWVKGGGGQGPLPLSGFSLGVGVGL